MNSKNNQTQNIEKLIKTPKFAYFYGYFAADGSFYRDSPRSTRFEFSDGTSVKSELRYSYEFLNRIREIAQELIKIKISPLRKIDNKFRLSFRSKFFESIFIEYFHIKPGTKTFSIDIPFFYKNTNLEKYFWLGVMDGDGMVARKSRKIALESGSKKLIESFERFLAKNKILFKKSERTLGSNKFFRVSIGSNFFNDYCNMLGFSHPRKKIWLLIHLKKDDFYKTNEISIKPFCTSNGMIDYDRLFDSEKLIVVDGKSLLKKYGLKYKGLRNRRFKEILEKFESLDLSREELFKILSGYRWKMGKGSTNSVILPFLFNKNILEIAQFVRTRDGSIGLSPQYIQSFNIEPKIIISKTEQIFDIKAKYTCRNEPIFCSGVLSLFFSKILKPNKKEYIPLNEYNELR